MINYDGVEYTDDENSAINAFKSGEDLQNRVLEMEKELKEKEMALNAANDIIENVKGRLKIIQTEDDYGLLAGCLGLVFTASAYLAPDLLHIPKIFNTLGDWVGHIGLIATFFNAGRTSVYSDILEGFDFLLSREKVKRKRGELTEGEVPGEVLKRLEMEQNSDSVGLNELVKNMGDSLNIES